jgi:hypothetical protein
MKETYYKRVGRRYVPVAEYDSDLSNSFGPGAHLVICKPGVTIKRYDIDAEYAPLIAAVNSMGDHLSRLIRHELEFKPVQAPITPEQKLAWENLATAFGNSLAPLQSESVFNVVEQAKKAIIDEAKQLLTNQSVKLAYENFLLVSALTKEQNHG